MGLSFYDRTLILGIRRKFRYVGYHNVETFLSEVNPPLIPDPDKDHNHEFVPMMRNNGVWIPGQREHAFPGWYSYRFITAVMGAPTRLIFAKEEEKKKEPIFEINMMEALMGWKAFCIEQGVLRSASQKTEWLPDQALKAKCTSSITDEKKKNCESPMATCSCGIYGGDARSSAEQYLGQGMQVGYNPEAANSTFLGTIAGWGKYVRHMGGWRAQYAYPQAFYLKQDQEHFVPILRKFHVPISVEAPIQVYSPEEDGYEHRTQEAYRNSGAAADSAAAEEGSTDDNATA